jgi:hypothetical protein
LKLFHCFEIRRATRRISHHRKSFKSMKEVKEMTDEKNNISNDVGNSDVDAFVPLPSGAGEPRIVSEVVEVPGIGKVYKTNIPDSCVAQSGVAPTYRMFSNYDIANPRSEVFPIAAYRFVITRCVKCHHRIVKVGDGYKHAIFFGEEKTVDGKKYRAYDKFSIMDKCHVPMEGAPEDEVQLHDCNCARPRPAGTYYIDATTNKFVHVPAD